MSHILTYDFTKFILVPKMRTTSFLGSSLKIE